MFHTKAPRFPPPERATHGEFIGPPRYPDRYEVVPGNYGGHGGYVVLLDHHLKAAWPFMTREGAVLSLNLTVPVRRAGTNWHRARHTYRRYTGATS